MKKLMSKIFPNWVDVYVVQHAGTDLERLALEIKMQRSNVVAASVLRAQAASNETREQVYLADLEQVYRELASSTPMDLVTTKEQ